MWWVIKNLGIGMIGFCVGRIFPKSPALAATMFIGLLMIIIGTAYEIRKIYTGLL